MGSKEKMTIQSDNYECRTSAEMTLDEQIEFTKQALSSAIRISENNKSDYWNNKIKEIEQRSQQLENIKSHLSEYDSYEVFDSDDMNAEEVIRWCYAAVRDNLLIRGLNRKEVLLLLEEYKLEKRLEEMTPAQLQNPQEKIADEIYAIKDNIICNRCHNGKIIVFEDHGGYSVRCDYCNAVNYCRCENEESAIRFWKRGFIE